MTPYVTLFIAVLIFFIGLKLSAFFSGSETGFYRVSTLQLTLQKQRGDSIGGRLFYFVAHPERFVATTLVGNNVANYITTLAVGLIVGEVWGPSTGAAEIVATLMLTPVIFVFGELIPKSLYYRSPMQLLRNGSAGFTLCYYVFLPISYPLILVSRFVSRLGVSDKRPLEVVFGRNRLYGVLEAGENEGLLSGLQRDLAENLMQVAEQPVALAMIPAGIMLGVPESASINQLLKMAGRTESAYVLLHKDGKPHEWTWIVRVADMLATGLTPRLSMQPMPVFQADTPRLEVLTQMMSLYAPFGVVVEDGVTVGVIRRKTLVSQLFRVVRPASSGLENQLTSGIPAGAGVAKSGAK